MSTRIDIVNGIIITVTVEIQTVDLLGVNVCGIIGGDESSPFGAVISSVAVVQAGVIVVVIAAMANRRGIFAPSLYHFHPYRSIKN